MKILHLCWGLEKSNGAANIARLIMGEQRQAGHDVSLKNRYSTREIASCDELWCHCGWYWRIWISVARAKVAGKRVRWLPECCYDPVRLKYHGWKKRLVGPLERWALRKADVLVATCEDEVEWIRAYVGLGCPRVEVTDIRRFFRLGEDEGNVRGEEREGLGAVAPRAGRQGGADGQTGRVGGGLRVLYLGRQHPLKGVGYLERAVAEVNGGELGEAREGLGAIAPRAGRQGGADGQTGLSDGQTGRLGGRVELRIVSEHTGEELERDWAWCDVLCLPTLSENFGLVVAEALEHGKRVITTDGAPAWADWRGPGLVYLRGFRDGTDGERVEMLRAALVGMMGGGVRGAPALPRDGGLGGRDAEGGVATLGDGAGVLGGRDAEGGVATLRGGTLRKREV